MKHDKTYKLKDYMKRSVIKKNSIIYISWKVVCFSSNILQAKDTRIIIVIES